MTINIDHYGLIGFSNPQEATGLDSPLETPSQTSSFFPNPSSPFPDFPTTLLNPQEDSVSKLASENFPQLQDEEAPDLTEKFDYEGWCQLNPFIDFPKESSLSNFPYEVVLLKTSQVADSFFSSIKPINKNNLDLNHFISTLSLYTPNLNNHDINQLFQEIVLEFLTKTKPKFYHQFLKRLDEEKSQLLNLILACLPPSITYLNFSQFENIDSTNLYYLSLNPHLQKINLAGCKNITDFALLYLSQNPYLQKINLAGCENITDLGLLYLSKNSHLQKINLAGCKNITNVGVKYISQFLFLEKLSLAGCESITKLALEYLNQCPLLQKLNLSGCENLSPKKLEPFRHKLTLVLNSQFNPINIKNKILFKDTTYKEHCPPIIF